MKTYDVRFWSNKRAFQSKENVYTEEDKDDRDGIVDIFLEF